MIEPPIPISTVNQNGIGSGPGTARRARAPITKPTAMTERIPPSRSSTVCQPCSNPALRRQHALDDDGHDEAIIFCPVRAEREFHSVE